MKKYKLIFLLMLLVSISVAMWLYKSPSLLAGTDLWHFVAILLVLGFAAFLGIKKLRGAQRGEPCEDELSKKILQKTAATSYYISLYVWVFLLFLKDRIVFDTEELLGTGILAMAVTYTAVWFVFNIKGLKHDE